MRIRQSSIITFSVAAGAVGARLLMVMGAEKDISQPTVEKEEPRRYASASGGLIPCMRSDVLFQNIQVDLDGRGLTVKRSEREQYVDEWDSSQLTLSASYKIEAIRSLGSGRLLVRGLARDDEVLEEWTIQWPPGAWVAEVGTAGEMDLSIRGGTYIPPANRSVPPLVSRAELFRGDTHGVFTAAVPNIAAPGSALVIRHSGGVTYVSDFDSISDTWSDITSGTVAPWVNVLDSFSAIYQMDQGELVYEICNSQGDRTADILILLDTEPDGAIDAQDEFHDIGQWEMSSYEDNAQVTKDYMMFEQ